ncbi:MAG: tripartite tricarboxylate transporter permease [Candidatus Methylomirabilota bacterium]
MDTLFHLITGFTNALAGMNLLYCAVGVVAGMFVGILPGLGPTAGTALLLPITFGMSPTEAIIMLAGIYYGAMYGGTITSVLINAPGEAASVITCLDGYPMSKQGRAGAALGVAAIGSFIGGIFSLIGLLIIGPLVAEQALKFGPPEYFCLMLMGLTLVVGLMGKSLVKGLIVALLGLMLSLIGTDPSIGTIRYSMGIDNLISGLDFVGIAMGAFGLAEIFESLEQNLRAAKELPKVSGLFPEKEEWPVVLKAIARGSFLGFFIGLIPGTNSIIPTVISYSYEKKLSRHPEKFGNGAIEGVAGPETANNSYCGGALVPLFTLGIPTSPVMAVLIGAFIIHGLTPGPTLFIKHADLVWTVIASMFIGNVLLVILNLPLAKAWAQVARIPVKILFPIIIIVALLGVYGINNNMFDVGSMIFFGIFGYFMKKAGFPMAPLLLTFILGNQLEVSLSQSMTIFRGDFTRFLTRPICLVLLSIVVITLVASAVTGTKRKEAFGDKESEM